MILSSCAALLLGTCSAAVAVISLMFSPSLSKVFARLGKWEIKSAFGEGPFLPVTVPAIAVLIMVITVSAVKEVKINEATLITYKKCDSKTVETKVAKIKIPGCLVALR